jgi:TonB family protein
MKAEFAAFAALMALAPAFAQTTPPGSAPQVESLKAPAYPPIALAARVSGEVHLRIALAADGTPLSVEMRSGPAMLQQSAIDSARGSRFQAPAQESPSQPLELTYRYVINPLECDQAPDPSYPRVSSETYTITITGQVMTICDPAAQIRVRSAKCLYLWRCSLK